MIRFIAPDLILWVVFRSMMSIAFKIKISRVNLDDLTGNKPCLGIPSYMIAHLKLLWHKF